MRSACQRQESLGPQAPKNLKFANRIDPVRTVFQKCMNQNGSSTLNGAPMFSYRYISKKRSFHGILSVAQQI